MVRISHLNISKIVGDLGPGGVVNLHTSFTSWLGWCSKLINGLIAAASGADVRALQLHMLREGTFIILSSMAPSFLLWTKLLTKVSKKWLGVSNMWELLAQEGQAGIQVFFFCQAL